MEEALDAENVATEFVAVSDEAVVVGYRTHRTDATNLFTELRVVVSTVLDHEPGREVLGAVFHTEHPVVGVWRVDADWADRLAAGELPETVLATRVLHTLRTVRFG